MKVSASQKAFVFFMCGLLFFIFMIFAEAKAQKKGQDSDNDLIVADQQTNLDTLEEVSDAGSQRAVRIPLFDVVTGKGKVLILMGVVLLAVMFYRQKRRLGNMKYRHRRDDDDL